MRFRHALAAAGLVLLTLPAAAQNFISNANFDANGVTTPWTVVPSNMTVLWDASDAFGNPASGSLHVTNTAATMYNAGPHTTCFPASVTAGNLYDFGARIRVPSGQSATGLAQFYVYWYSDLTCTAGLVSQVATPAAPATNVWTLSTLTSQVAPASAQSVSFYLMTYKNVATGTFEAYWDRVFFGPVGTTPVSLQKVAAN